MVEPVFRGFVPPDDPLFKTATIFTLPRGWKRPATASVDDAAKANEERAKPPGDFEQKGR